MKTSKTKIPLQYHTTGRSLFNVIDDQNITEWCLTMSNWQGWMSCQKICCFSTSSATNTSSLISQCPLDIVQICPLCGVHLAAVTKKKCYFSISLLTNASHNVQPRTLCGVQLLSSKQLAGMLSHQRKLLLPFFPSLCGFFLLPPPLVLDQSSAKNLEY